MDPFFSFFIFLFFFIFDYFYCYLMVYLLIFTVGLFLDYCSEGVREGPGRGLDPSVAAGLGDRAGL